MKHPATYQEAIEFLQLIRNYRFVCFTTDPDEDLPGDFPIVSTYIDAPPDGYDMCILESIPINKDFPNWPEVMCKVEELLDEAKFSTDRTYILLDMEQSMGAKEVSERMCSLFRRVLDEKISNFILPDSILDNLCSSR